MLYVYSFRALTFANIFSNHMAKQAGLIKITGTIDNITFYEMNGNFYCRMKSSLTKRRFMTDPAFANSRRNARWFGEASKSASRIYRQLPFQQRGHGVFPALVGRIYKMKRQGMQEVDAERQLLQEMLLQKTDNLQAGTKKPENLQPDIIGVNGQHQTVSRKALVKHTKKAGTRVTIFNQPQSTSLQRPKPFTIIYGGMYKGNITPQPIKEIISLPV